MGISWVTNWLKWPVVALAAAFIIDIDVIDRLKAVSIDLRLLLDYVRTLAWPVVVLLIFINTKKYIPAVVDRLEEIAAGKFKAKLRRPAEQEVESDEIANLEDGKKPAEAFDEDVIEAQLTTPAAHEAYKLIYDNIYGSQLLVLKRLSTVIPEGMKDSDLQDLYKAHTESSAQAYPSFKHFIQFLIDTVMILYDASDQHYKLTNAGVYFLKYLSDTNQYHIAPNQ